MMIRFGVTLLACSWHFEQEFSDPRDADDARYSLDGRDVEGSRIIVEFAKGVGITSLHGLPFYFILFFQNCLSHLLLAIKGIFSVGAIFLG